jgi:uncharacterized protein (TIGR02147 family)
MKGEKRWFTVEFIAQQVGLRSKGHISLILQGKKNIPLDKIPAFARVFELDEKESGFFRSLILYNQATTHRDKKIFLDKMVAQLRIADTRLVPSQYRLCEKWYYPPVHELLRLHNISDNFRELARLLIPQISEKEAQEAVQVLKSIRMIEKNEKGFWKPTDIVLTFGEGWQSVAAREFQRHTLDMAQQALDEIDKKERDISTMTLSMSEKTFHSIQDSIKLFRKEILAMVRADQDASKVYQLNLAMFPLSQSRVDSEDNDEAGND